MKKTLVLPALLLLAARPAHAGGLRHVRFVVVDPKTHRRIAGAWVRVEEIGGTHPAQTLFTDFASAGPTNTLDLPQWTTRSEKVGAEAAKASGENETGADDVTLIAIPAGASVVLTEQRAPAAPAAAPPNSPGQTPAGAQNGSPQPPVRDIYIRVTASLLRRPQSATGSGTSITGTQLQQRLDVVGAKGNDLVRNTAGASSDSNGQQHVRGEHAELAYVVDGVLLPDTLSGRQGSIVVPSTINSLEILTGGFAPEFGGQTAAILNITTLPGSRKPHADFTLEGGNYDTSNGALTVQGPFGSRARYLFNFGATRTSNYLEPQQPDNQSAHNTGSDQDYFGKFRYTPGRSDTLDLTLSRAPGTLQLSNRTGLPSSFASAGQGFGFLGLRNADGTRPDVVSDPKDPNYNAGLLGAQNTPLPSQQQDGQDITQREVNEFATLAWQHRLSARDVGLLAVTFLHSGQDIHNHNPAVDLLNLPVDNSIEYNPTVARNVHHVQFTGSLSARRGKHQFKTGLLLDDQNGSESYQLIPGSQLALNELAALTPNLAPSGSLQLQLDAGGQPFMDAQGSPVYVKDINGNPVYKATSGTSPTLTVHRTGFYRAAYAQDTWQPSRRFTFNYGLRADWYKQTQNLGQQTIDTYTLSPRLNFSYALDHASTLRWSYNRLFNIPPLAQGAVVGEPIQPETLDQYDVSVERQIGVGQNVKLAYYIKDIRNQVDTGLLIPGSQIGIYSGVNFQIGGVHGIELSYDVAPTHGEGLDAFFNYSYSIARPNGTDNTGAPAPDFNDHDQRNTIGFGLAYDWKGGASIGMTLEHGSGLASSVVPPNATRTPRTQVDFRLTSGPRLFARHGSLGLSVENVFDDRTVINFQSGFSGTRFQQGRRVLLSLSGTF